MAKLKVLCRIGAFDEKHIPELEAVVAKAGGIFLRIKTIPDTEHWLEYHCRFRRKVKGIRRFARDLVQLDEQMVAERKTENERLAAAGKELLPAKEPFSITWPNEERRAAAGAMVEEFLENNSSVRADLEAPEGSYERDVGLEKVKSLIERMKRQLDKDYEDAES
jgi:hypothetical protein